MLEAATEQHRAGQFAEARRLYREVLARVPAHPVALFRSGLLELQDGHPEAALLLVEGAVAADAAEPRYPFVLGQSLQALRRWDPAIGAYETALKLQPDFLDAWNNLGICRQLRRQFPQAAAAYRQALALNPANAGVMANLGTVLREMGDWAQAVELLRAAADLEPAVASHTVNLGIAYWNQGNFVEAERTLNQALARAPNDADAAFNLGNALHGLGRAREAIDRYRQAVALRPGYLDAWINLGNVLTEIGDFGAGQAAYDDALRLRPDSVVALNNAACLLRTMGRVDEAEAALSRALQLDPGNATLHDTLGNVLQGCRRPRCGDRQLPPSPRIRSGRRGDAQQSCLRAQLSIPGGRSHSRGMPALERALRRALPVSAADHGNETRSEPPPENRLRLAGFPRSIAKACSRFHCSRGMITRPSKSSAMPASSARTITPAASPATPIVWRDVRALNDEALCRLIRDDRIDILVDLTMHMAGGRPLLFARKPAPVQIAWLAYPGTTGIGAMDYRLSDPRLDPDGFDGHYSERTLRLPDSFWCYDPLADDVDVGPLPALERGYLTLGCLNNPCKLTDHTLRLWGGVMRALPSARLLLMAPPGRHRERLSRRLAAHGIAAERVDYRAFQPRAEYLRSYHDIDLGLDTFPYNGHTTSLDSLWMGVPVVTRVGRTCVGRGGLSQLFQLDLLDLAAESDEAFIAIAAALGHDLIRLAALRRELRARLERSALMDAPRFARHMEHAFRSAWRTYCEQTHPR